MPPRQPLKLKKPAAKRTRKPAAGLAMPPQPETPARPAARSNTGFSPYPDLTMAIGMLTKRHEHLPDGERRQLIAKWLESLNKVQAEMQKLHKLEVLANRLTLHPDTTKE